MYDLNRSTNTLGSRFDFVEHFCGGTFSIFLHDWKPFSPVNSVIIDDFNCLWNLSTIPFDCGWYELVPFLFELITILNCVKTLDSNCRPWSGGLYLLRGTPNLESGYLFDNKGLPPNIPVNYR